MKMDRRLFLRSSAVVAAGAGMFGKDSLAHANAMLRLVVSGTANATVVVDPNADAQTAHAADEVIRYVEEATGATLPLATFDPANPVTGNRILVGVLAAGSGVTPQEVADLGQDGYIIRRAGNDLTIVGRDGWGTRYGVYEFCERYLDVRWLMPDELVPGQVGRDVPTSTDVTVPNADITESPAYIERMLHPLPPLNRKFMEWDWEADNAPWLTAQARSWGDYARLRHAVEYGHNLWRVISPSKYGDPNKPATYHPEFFPIRDGQTVIPAPNSRSGWQPRFSAPGIAAAAADEVLTYLRANPNTRSYSLGVNDRNGYSDDDIDPAGVTNVFGYRTYSEAYYTFVNDVAALVSQEFPDVLLGVLAYQRVGRPPSFNLHPNVIPFLTRDTYFWVRDDVRHRDIPWVDRWAQVSEQFGIWNYVWGASFCIPRMYLCELGRTYSDLYAKGCVAGIAQADEPWGEGPKMWVLSKLYQDPSQSVSRLAHEWCARVAGRRAAPYLWAYYRLWERIWTDRIPQSEWFNRTKRSVYPDRHDPGYLEVLTEEDIDQAREHLQRAADLTATQAQASRVEVMTTWFAYYEASALSYPKPRALPGSAADAISTVDDAAAVLDRNIALAHDRLQMGDLFHQGQPRGNDHPQRYGLVWSGWDLYAAWAVAAYIRDHEPQGGPVCDHVSGLADSAGSATVRQLARWIDALGEGDVVTHDDTSFEDGTLAPWTIRNGTVDIVQGVAHTGTRSLHNTTNTGSAIKRDNIQVRPGFYRFQAHLHVPASSPHPGYFALLRTDLFDDSGKRKRRLDKRFAFDDAVGDWYRVAFTELIEPGMASATCELHFYHTDAYVDDISITQIDTLAAPWHQVWTDTFTQDTPGSPPAGWTASLPGVLVVQTEASDNFLTIQGSASPTPAFDVQRSFDAVDNDVVRVSLRYRPEQDRVNTNVILRDSADRPVVRLHVSQTHGDFRFYDIDLGRWVSTGVIYTLGTWYAIDVVVQQALGWYEVYIDSTFVGSARLVSPDAGPATELRVHANAFLRDGQAACALDDVTLSVL